MRLRVVASMHTRLFEHVHEVAAYTREHEHVLTPVCSRTCYRPTLASARLAASIQYCTDHHLSDYEQLRNFARVLPLALVALLLATQSFRSLPAHSSQQRWHRQDRKMCKIL